MVKSAKEFTDLYRAKYNAPPDSYAVIAYTAYMEMFRGFEAAKSFDPAKVTAALMANNGEFSTVKGPSRWREDHVAEYKYAAFLVKGKSPSERKDEWDLFTVMGALGAQNGESVLPLSLIHIFRHGGKDEARSFFELGMGRVFKRMREATDPRFPTTIYYAFKQAEGEDEDDEVLALFDSD